MCPGGCGTWQMSGVQGRPTAPFLGPFLSHPACGLQGLGGGAHGGEKGCRLSSNGTSAQVPLAPGPAHQDCPVEPSPLPLPMALGDMTLGCPADRRREVPQVTLHLASFYQVAAALLPPAHPSASTPSSPLSLLPGRPSPAVPVAARLLPHSTFKCSFWVRPFLSLARRRAH